MLCQLVYSMAIRGTLFLKNGMYVAGIGYTGIQVFLVNP